MGPLGRVVRRLGWCRLGPGALGLERARRPCWLALAAVGRRPARMGLRRMWLAVAAVGRRLARMGLARMWLGRGSRQLEGCMREGCRPVGCRLAVVAAERRKTGPECTAQEQ